LILKQNLLLNYDCFQTQISIAILLGHYFRFHDTPLTVTVPLVRHGVEFSGFQDNRYSVFKSS